MALQQVVKPVKTQFQNI